MFVIPAQFESRCQEYCQSRQIQSVDLIGYGLDGFVWSTNRDSVLKVFRQSLLFDQELAIYEKLTKLGLRRLQGFDIPVLLDYDAQRSVLELSFVSPPFILDFAAASLKNTQSDIKPPGWLGEKQRLFGTDWPEVQRLLDALRLYGIHFPDVHLGNIRLRK